MTATIHPDIDRRAHLLALPPVLRAGFRPFFFGGALWAVVVVALWIGILAGGVSLPTAFDPLAWHRHEMLFGYLAAIIAGFILTAIPNWTGRLPLKGAPLALLAALWLAGRIAVLFSAALNPWVVALIDGGFLLVLAAFAAREVVIAGNRNVPVVAAIALLGVASVADHAEAAGLPLIQGLGWRAGFALVVLLISLIGGRIIPSFTRNWLAKSGRTEGLPVQPNRFDLTVIIATAAALVAWAASAPATVQGGLAGTAGLLQLARLWRWSGLATWREPLVLILHVAYAWLPIGLLLLGWSAFDPEVHAASALHALSAGAMGSMTLAVMTRATLGHTGHQLTANRLTIALYAMVTAGAALRVAAPWLPLDYVQLLAGSGLLWSGAFLLFLIGYGPKLLGPRPDGRP